MSDQRSDDAIRDALLTDDPGNVPVRLKARMAMIPEETARQASSGWRARLATFAVPAAVLSAVAVIVLVFGGIALRGQLTATAVPSVAPASPQGSAQASVPSPTQSATTSTDASPRPSASTTATSAPTGPITIDTKLVTGLQPGTFAVKDNVAYQFNRIGVSGWPTLSLNSPAGSNTVTNMVELKNGHDIASYALTDAGIVWVETWYTQKPVDCAGRTPCSPHEYQPVSWALNLTALDGKTTTRLDTGVVSRTSVGGELAGPLPPEMAAQGGRVAYAVPRPNVQGSPEASQILVRSLPDGSLVRKVDTDGYVAQLSVFGQAIAFRDALNVAGDKYVDPGDATLYATASDAQEPTALATHVAGVAMGDGGVVGPVRIAWAPVDQNSATIDVADLSGATPTVVRATAGTSGPASQLAVVGDGVVWIAQTQDSAGAWSSVVNAWHAGWAGGRSIPSLGSPDSIGASADALLVGGDQVPVLKTVGAVMGSVPASALFGGQ